MSVAASENAAPAHRFQEAMAQYTVDHVGRMKQIKATLDQSDETAEVVQQKQDMLEELMDIVDNIDYARGMSCWCEQHT